MIASHLGVHDLLWLGLIAPVAAGGLDVLYRVARSRVPLLQKYDPETASAAILGDEEKLAALLDTPQAREKIAAVAARISPFMYPTAPIIADATHPPTGTIASNTTSGPVAVTTEAGGPAGAGGPPPAS